MIEEQLQRGGDEAAQGEIHAEQDAKIKAAFASADADSSGTIEYNEFAPLMFNWMVEALKLGFMQAQMGELEMYMLSHLSAYDPSGLLPFETLKQGLFDMDLVQLTPIQVSLASPAEPGQPCRSLSSWTRRA